MDKFQANGAVIIIKITLNESLFTYQTSLLLQTLYTLTPKGIYNKNETDKEEYPLQVCLAGF